MTCSFKLKETVRQNKRTVEGNSASEKKLLHYGRRGDQSISNRGV